MTAKEPTANEIKDQRIYAQWGLSDDEYRLISDDILGRLPNYTETGLYSVMWSEHCSYKHSIGLLRTFPSDGPQVLQGPGEGAGVVDIGDGLGVAFKMESHNHPSAVEPYEGAATGVGGILRDVFSMGATPIATLNSLRFGHPDDERTKFLVREVVAGLAGYGNTIGLPTIAGEIVFDDCYRANPLVNAMAIGLIEHEQIQAGRTAGAGNPVIYAGAKTGRDGIHGATFASESFGDEGDEQERSAVQAGDPFLERRLMDACLDLIHNHSDLLVGIQDMGAAGLVSSSSEMAAKGGTGLRLDLDLVPTREEGMTPYEMMLSESQERMLLCVKDGTEDEVVELFADYDLEAVVIGEVTEGDRYQLFFHGEKVADLPVNSLADAPELAPAVRKPERLENPGEPWQPNVADPSQTLLDLLARPTIASKRALFQTFDYQSRADTVVPPGSDAGVVRVRGTNRAVAATADCNAGYLYLDPRRGAEIAVAESARNLVASGARPLAITDCLNFGDPENPEVFWEFTEAVGGIGDACRALGTPVISGNVSLYNEAGTEAIYPTPVIGAVGVIDDLNHITTQQFKQAGDAILVVGETRADFDGSELQKLQEGEIFGPLMGFDLDEEKAAQALVYAAITRGLISSAHDLSEGGLAVAVAESCFPPTSESRDPWGAELQVDMPAANLFAETQSRFVISTSPENVAKLQELQTELAADGPAVPLAVVGTVTATGSIKICAEDGTVEVNSDAALDAWDNSLAKRLTEAS